ncbi:MAG: acyltransferase [Flavobacteriales bacterium]|nr:acyltransferase [Flavobacteriales bacterium]HQW39647.1 acyltransferase [Flavobacteriales bacterium]
MATILGSPVPHPNNSRFLALDGMRAVCAYMVMLHHFGPDVPMLQHPFVLGLLGQFNLGVTPFFVLSGFVITYHYFDLPISGYKPYLMRRLGRIAPLYVLLTTVTYLALVQQGVPVDRKLLSVFFIDLAMLKGWFNDLKFAGIIQGWSITTEMMFYLLAPLLFTVIRRWGWGIVVFLPLVFVGLGLLLVYIIDGNAPYGFMGSNSFMFGITFLGRAPDFFAGIGLALLYRKYGSHIRTRYTTLLGVIAIAVCLIVRAHFNRGYADFGGVVISNFLLPVLGVGLLFWGLITEETALRRLLSTKLFQVLGRSSYAFYLIHMGVFYSAIHSVLGSFPATILALQVLAFVLYRAIEVPCVRWAKQQWPFPEKVAIGRV